MPTDPRPNVTTKKGAQPKSEKSLRHSQEIRKHLGFVSISFGWLQRKELQKETHKLNSIQPALMNKKNGVTSPDITWLQAFASHQNFKMFTGFGVRFERWKSWNIGSQRANTFSNSDSGVSFDELVETTRHQTNRALSSTKQQRSNTKHYKTTKIER